MPNKNTFQVKPIREFVSRYLKDSQLSVDPFARNANLATFTNDINPKTSAQYHLHALDFLNMLIEKNVKTDLVIFDPPYSPHQTKECYSGFGINMKYEDDARHGWSKTRKAISKLVKPDGIVLSFGWNTVGIGKKQGFKQIEIGLVSHGIGHNDTICLAEIKKNQQLICSIGAQNERDF